MVPACDSAAPIVGVNSKGIRRAWRSFTSGDQPLGVLDHLSVGRAPGGSLSVRLSAVEAHGCAKTA